MKILFTSIFLFISGSILLAQNPLLSEDFDYPVGTPLNTYGWKPLTSATNNPIKIVSGLAYDGYSAKGGAVYLSKNGQDVIKSFESVTDRFYMSFQLNAIKTYSITNGRQDNFQAFPFSPSSYFMFLSSKEQPTVPLLKFSIVTVQLAGPEHHLVIRDSQNVIIADFRVYLKGTFNLSYQISGKDAGTMMVSDGRSENTLGDFLYIKGTKERISNLSNLVLCQSDVNVGTEAVIDRIRIGKSFASIMPCFEAYKNKFLSETSTLNIGTGSIANNVKYDLVNHSREIIFKTCANTEIKDATSLGVYNASLGLPITDLQVNVPNGFKTSVYADGPFSSDYMTNGMKNLSSSVQMKAFPMNGYYPTQSNFLKIFLTGNSTKISANGNPITGDTGTYEGEVSFIPIGGYCQKTTWKVKGIIENCNKSSAFSTISVYPNITDGTLNLLAGEDILDKDLEVKLTDNQGNTIFINADVWQNMKPKIESILKQNNEGVFYLTVSNGVESKTMRVLKQ